MDEEKQEKEILPEERFNRFMFGEKRRHRSLDQQHQEQGHQPDSSHQSSVDYTAIFQNIDALLESTQNLKPVFKKIYPYIEQIWKKK